MRALGLVLFQIIYEVSWGRMLNMCVCLDGGDRLLESASLQNCIADIDRCIIDVR